MHPILVVVIGFFLALWMSMGRWLFGLGGSLTLWYLPTIALIYFSLHLWIAKLISRARKKGRTTGRGTKVTLVASWCAALFTGFMMPDFYENSLTSIASHFTGSATMLEMAIALSNTVGIISFALAGAAVGFSMADQRDPTPEPEYDGPIPMQGHPLL